MATSMLELSMNTRSPARESHPLDQAPIEMNTLEPRGAGSALAASRGTDIPAWNMSPKKEWTAIAVCCACLFLAGWNDATTGPLLPAIQSHYRINFTVVSMLFVSTFGGFISAAIINGLSLQDAQANGFVAALPNNTSAKMGILHGIYGAGAFVAPLVATQFSQLPRWSFHYLTSLGVSVVNAVIVVAVFKLRSLDEILGIQVTRTDPNTPTAANNTNKYREIFTSRAVQLMAFFIWFYVGVEVTIGGWFVTFVIQERGGGSSAGYISSGFFGGLMLGRVALIWVNEKLGERRVIYLYSLLVVGLELTIWFVPNIIGNGIAVSLSGLPLGYAPVVRGTRRILIAEM
ncbi:hypothetical protein FRC06_000827 [Ceratobasidium sp. 370]|nr:hypothetical protein FRC06_000827 [Ceratobasidium sp. 370]